MMYTKDRLDALRQEFWEHEEILLKTKRGEYAEDGDCLKNFRQLAEFLGMRPEEVCMVYLTKHMQSLQRAVSTGRYHFDWWNPETKVEGLKQRIADARNYLQLLAAILDDKQ